METVNLEKVSIDKKLETFITQSRENLSTTLVYWYHHMYIMYCLVHKMNILFIYIYTWLMEFNIDVIRRDYAFLFIPPENQMKVLHLKLKWMLKFKLNWSQTLRMSAPMRFKSHSNEDGEITAQVGGKRG